ncbi:hypothetical protein KAI19_05950 [bacterium]|nr:hypothetical protein [bacterium]
MRTKILLIICFLILFCGMETSVRAGETRISISQLKLSWADYENKIIRIGFYYATDIFQVDKGICCATLWDKDGNNVYAKFKTAGLNYIQRTSKRKRRWYVSTIVIKTTLQNKYGATSIGPMLKLIGHRHKSMGFKARYRW